MDSLLLQNITVWTRIGVDEEERRNPQLLRVTVELLESIQAVAVSDDVRSGIDYAQVVETIRKTAETERRTVERFAEDLATVIRTMFAMHKVRVTVEKRPALPLEAVRLTIERP